MLHEWTDGLPDAQADTVWRNQLERQTTQRLQWIEAELKRAIERRDIGQPDFFDAMHHFLVLRDKLFPGMASEPAWRMLVTLARTPPDSDLTCITSVAYGAEVPLTTALRYIAVMEVNGIVERVPHAEDARRVMIRLTPEGRRRLDEISDRWMSRLLWVVAVPAVLLALSHFA